MEKEGPSLEILLRRLVETPPDFLDEPHVDSTEGAVGRVRVEAVVSDFLKSHRVTTGVSDLEVFRGKDVKTDRNRLALTLISVWLLAHEWFLAQKLTGKALIDVLREAPGELAQVNASTAFVRDPDRREELVRVLLSRLGFRPQGETPSQATDRLSAISGTERKRLLEAARLADKRAREIREALAKKAADEAADKYTRE